MHQDGFRAYATELINKGATNADQVTIEIPDNDFNQETKSNQSLEIAFGNTSKRTNQPRSFERLATEWESKTEEEKDGNENP